MHSSIIALEPLAQSWCGTHVVCGVSRQLTVQHDDRAIGRGLQVLQHALEREAHGGLVKVAVLLPLHARVGENVLVVAPAPGGRLAWVSCWLLPRDFELQLALVCRLATGLPSGSAHQQWQQSTPWPACTDGWRTQSPMGLAARGSTPNFTPSVLSCFASCFTLDPATVLFRSHRVQARRAARRSEPDAGAAPRQQPETHGCAHRPEHALTLRRALTAWGPASRPADAHQVGLDRYTVRPGRNLLMNSAPTRRLPVPDSDCSVATRSCAARRGADSRLGYV